MEQSVQIFLFDESGNMPQPPDLIDGDLEGSKKAINEIQSHASSKGASIDKKSSYRPGRFTADPLSGARLDEAEFGRRQRADLGRPARKFGEHLGYLSDLITITFASAGSAVAALKLAKPALIKWLDNKKNRTLTIKSKGFELRITGSNDIDKFVEAVNRLPGGLIPTAEPGDSSVMHVRKKRTKVKTPKRERAGKRGKR
jgi:hypothetical protein